MPRQHWLEIMMHSFRFQAEMILHDKFHGNGTWQHTSWRIGLEMVYGAPPKGWFNHPAVQVQRYAEPVLLVCALNVAFECVCTDSRHEKAKGWILLSVKAGVTYIIYFFDMFCWTPVLLSDSIRRMFWEWAHACVKVSTFTTIIRHTKLSKWYENSCSQLYILIHILKFFLNGPNNLSFQNSRRAFHWSEWFSKPQKRSSDKEVDLLCCWLWKVIGSHHRPYNLQYSCCHVAYD